jgi:hypothetical protein
LSQSIVYTGPLAAVETPDGTVFTKGVPVPVSADLAAALLLQSFAEVTSNGDVGALPVTAPSVAPASAADSASPVPPAAPVPDVTATPTDTGVPATSPQPAASFTAAPAVDAAPAPAPAPADPAPAPAPTVLAPVSGVTN